MTPWGGLYSQCVYQIAAFPYDTCLYPFAHANDEALKHTKMQSNYSKTINNNNHWDFKLLVNFFDEYIYKSQRGICEALISVHMSALCFSSLPVVDVSDYWDYEVLIALHSSVYNLNYNLKWHCAFSTTKKRPATGWITFS